MSTPRSSLLVQASLVAAMLLCNAYALANPLPDSHEASNPILRADLLQQPASPFPAIYPSRFGAKSLEGALVTVDTTQGDYAYFAHGTLLMDLDASNATVAHFNLVSNPVTAFTFRGAKQRLGSGPVRIWMDRRSSNQPSRRASDGSLVVPITIRVSFATHKFVASTSSLAALQPTDSSTTTAAPADSASPHQSTSSFTELSGELRCSFEGPDPARQVLACSPLDLSVAPQHRVAGTHQTFIQAMTITFPGALPRLGADLLTTVDQYHYCYRYHRLKVGSTYGECPSFTGMDSAWGNCCFNMVKYSGGDLEWPDSQAASVPIAWEENSPYIALHESSLEEGLETGCTEMMTIFCVAQIAGDVGGYTFVDPGVMLVRDTTNSHKLAAHEVGHSLGILHTDEICVSDHDVASASNPNFNTPDDICTWSRLSDRAYVGTGSCTLDPTTCS